MIASAGLAVSAGLLLSMVAHAAPNRPLVQKRYLRITSGSTVSVTFRKPNTAGDLIVAYVVWDNGGAASVTDSAGNAYASAIGPTTASGDPTSAQIFYAANVGGGTNTITATFATAITVRGVLYVHEYRGIDRVSPLDAAGAASGSSAAMDSGPVTASFANDLLFVGGESNGRAVVHVTRYQATAPLSGGTWVMQLVAFEPP